VILIFSLLSVINVLIIQLLVHVHSETKPSSILGLRPENNGFASE
jgi:hypothetical protein